MHIILKDTFKNSTVVALALFLALAVMAPASARAATAPSLDDAEDFAVLAGSGITNTGATTITGDVGSFPTTTQTGFGSVTITGTNHMGDATTQAAKTDLTAAYNNAAGQSTTGVIAADLGGQTLGPGVYTDNDAPDSLSITGTLTLDGGGDADSIFIFQSGSTLTTASGSVVNLINDAQACNVFWQIGSSVTLGTTSDFSGTILASDSITDNGGSTIDGRLLASGALVTLNNTTITVPTCAAPSPSPSSSSGGGGAASFVPLISLVKIPTPLALEEGPGSVTYDYVVKNPSIQALSDVTLTDDMCSPLTLLSGDENGDNLLDPSETWHYSCVMTLSATTTNTAIATGYGNGGQSAIATAIATVVVGSPMVPPLINIVKVPSRLTPFPFGGGSVMYTYTVTNPGIVAMHDVGVTDDKCGPVGFISGDNNDDNLLDPGETWTYGCRMNVVVSTRNIATARGEANGFTALGYAFANVLVAGPGLPNTGLPLSTWNIVTLAAVLGIALAAFILLRKNKKSV